MTNGPSTSDKGLLPAWALLPGWLLFTGQTIFISRIVYESTVLTCFHGPQMVGFAMLHGAHSFFLLGLFFLPFGALFAIAMLVFGALKKFRFQSREWVLLAALIISFSALFVPYEAWERLDMKFCGAPGPLGDQFLRDAAITGDLGRVKKLVSEGCELNHASGAGDTPLSNAVKGRSIEVARFLLANGADVSLRNSLTGETPLMEAANSGDTEMLKLLLAQGADPCAVNRNLENWNQENAQRIAEKKHNQSAAEYLAAHSHCSLPPPPPMTCTNESAATCVEVH